MPRQPFFYLKEYRASQRNILKHFEEEEENEEKPKSKFIDEPLLSARFSRCSLKICLIALVFVKVEKSFSLSR